MIYGLTFPRPSTAVFIISRESPQMMTIGCFISPLFEFPIKLFSSKPNFLRLSTWNSQLKHNFRSAIAFIDIFLPFLLCRFEVGGRFSRQKRCVEVMKRVFVDAQVQVFPLRCCNIRWLRDHQMERKKTCKLIFKLPLKYHLDWWQKSNFQPQATCKCAIKITINYVDEHDSLKFMVIFLETLLKLLQFAQQSLAILADDLWDWKFCMFVHSSSNSFWQLKLWCSMNGKTL